MQPTGSINTSFRAAACRPIERPWRRSRRSEAGHPSRNEYQRLLLHLPALSSLFGFELSDASRENASVLVGTVECVDRLLDQLPDPAERGRLCQRVKASVGNGVWPLDTLREVCPRADPELPDELDVWLRKFRNLSAHSLDPARFARFTGQVLDNSEAMRTTVHIGNFIRHAVGEGQLFVDLLLLILKEPVPEDLARFLRAVAGPSNLWDKLVDAPGDQARGECACRPLIFSQGRLLLGFLWRLIPLAAFTIRRPALFLWGLRALRDHWRDTVGVAVDVRRL